MKKGRFPSKYIVSFTQVKEESEKVGLKLNIQKTKITASGPITSWQIDGETMESVTDSISLGLPVNGLWQRRVKKLA